MAKLKFNINEDTTKVKYGVLRPGEVFIFDIQPYIKTTDTSWAINLEDGDSRDFYPDDLVTYVKKAELKLTI